MFSQVYAKQVPEQRPQYRPYLSQRLSRGTEQDGYFFKQSVCMGVKVTELEGDWGSKGQSSVLGKRKKDLALQRGTGQAQKGN